MSPKVCINSIQFTELMGSNISLKWSGFTFNPISTSCFQLMFVTRQSSDFCDLFHQFALGAEIRSLFWSSRLLAWRTKSRQSECVLAIRTLCCGKRSIKQSNAPGANTFVYVRLFCVSLGADVYENCSWWGSFQTERAAGTKPHGMNE